MKKAGVLVLLLICVVAGGLSRRSSSSVETRSSGSEASGSGSVRVSSKLNLIDKTQPALEQLRTQVSEERTESVAEQVSFQNRLEDLMAEMPTLNNQAKPETDVDGHIHGSIPEELVEARVLGQLRKAVFENPQHAARSQVIYAGCAERADLSNAVRAVCFMRALELSIKVKNPQLIAALEVPVQVRNLAQKLISKGKL